MSESKQQSHLPAQRAVALFFLGLIFGAIFLGQRSSVALAINRGERIPVLVYGVDADPSSRIDSALVAVFDPMQNFLSVLSVPRDTSVADVEPRARRLSEVYEVEFKESHDRAQVSALVARTVEELLSSPSSKISIPYVVGVNYADLQKLIELEGGIWVDGWMKGPDALAMLRYRSINDDRARLLRQWSVVRAIARRSATPKIIRRWPRLRPAFSDGFSANLSFGDALYLAAALRRLRGPDVHFYSLPGRAVGSSWALDPDLAQRLGAAIVLGRAGDISGSETIVPQADRVTINVWNGSGQKGLAYKITAYLRERGYDVVEWGNYLPEQAQTRIVDRRGKIGNAQAIANELGIEAYQSEPNPSTLVDVEVFIGRNFAPPAALNGSPF